MTQFDLASKACLVFVKVRNPSFKKTSKALSAEVEGNHGAAESTVNAVVRMVPDKYLKPLAKHAQRLRRTVEAYSACWATSGVRIMPYARVSELKQRVDADLADWQGAVDTFVNQYSAIRAEAMTGLNGLQAYVAGAWPEVEQVRSLFDARVGFMPVTNVDSDFRLALSADEADAMRADMQAQIESSLAEAHAENRERAAEVLQRFVDAVGKYRVIADENSSTGVRVEGGFWSQTVTNVREVADGLRHLNFIGDAAFDAVMDRMAALGGVDADHMKLSDTVRESALSEANALLSALSR